MLPSVELKEPGLGWISESNPDASWCLHCPGRCHLFFGHCITFSTMVVFIFSYICTKGNLISRCLVINASAASDARIARLAASKSFLNA